MLSLLLLLTAPCLSCIPSEWATLMRFLIYACFNKQQIYVSTYLAGFYHYTLYLESLDDGCYKYICYVTKMHENVD